MENRIRQAIENCMAANRRKQNFHCVVEIGGTGIKTAPECEYLDYDDNYKGFCNIQRFYWFNMPEYAERVCRNLANIMSINN